MASSVWQIGRQRDFRGGETQTELPEAIAPNQLIRMENALIYPSGWLTAVHNLDTEVITGATLGICLVAGENGTYTVHSAPGDGKIYSSFFDTETSSLNMAGAKPLFSAIRSMAWAIRGTAREGLADR